METKTRRTADPPQIRPFVEETIRTFQAMAGVSLVEQGVALKNEGDATYDVSAYMGIAGPISGAVVLSCPAGVLCRTVSLILRQEMPEVNADVTDGLCEIVNIIVGNACRILSQQGYTGLSTSLPGVVVGKHRRVWRSRDLPCLIVRLFDSNLGVLSLEMNLRVARAK